MNAYVELGLVENDGVPWIRWWDETGNLLLTGDERAVKAEGIAEQERQQKEKLAAYLRSLGINPDDI